MKLSLPGGVGRKIQVLGVATSFGTAVIGKDVTALFEQGRLPRLYELAVAKDQTLLTNSKIALTSTSTGPTDILGKCFANTSAGGASSAAITGVAIAVATFNQTSPALNSIQGVFMDKDTGAFTIKSGYPTQGIYIENVEVTPDGRRLLAWQKTGGYNDSFDVGIDGTLQHLASGADRNPFSGAEGLTFSNDGQYAVTRGVGFLGFGKFSPSGVMGSNGGTPNLTSDFGAFAAIGPYFFARRAYATTGFRVISGPFSDNYTFGGDTPLFQTGAIEFMGSVRGPSILTSKGLYAAFAVGGPTALGVQFYAYNGISNLAAVGARASASIANLDEVRMAVSPDSRFLFVKSNSSTLQTWTLDASGGIVAELTPSYLIPGLRTIRVDPSSKFLIAGSAAGASSTLTAYPIQADGRLGNPVTLSSGLAPELYDFVAMPLH